MKKVRVSSQLKLLMAASATALLTSACGGVSVETATESEAVESTSAAEPAPTEDPTTWPPRAEEEAAYLERFQTLQEAFASGAATTTYDTLGPVRGAAGDELTVRTTSPDMLDADTIEAINAYADAANTQALIVAKDGALLHEAYFNGADADTLIVGKSLAKPLGVVAIGRAIQEGYIDSLDQPVSDFITEWQGTDYDAILIRHLLEMRSGLLPQGGAPEPENVLNRAYLHPQHDEVIIHEYPLTHVPGERYEYSNANAELVAPVIERATGIQYEDWVADEILIPIGAPGGEVWMNRPGGTAHAGCCILLPARTWLELGQLVMNDGVVEDERILPEGFVADMVSPTPQNTHSGMGVYIGQPYLERRGFMNPEMPFGKSYHSEPYVDQDLYLFDGNSNQVVYFMPSKELIVLRVGNSPPKEPEWDNAYLPNLISRALATE